MKKFYFLLSALLLIAMKGLAANAIQVFLEKDKQPETVWFIFADKPVITFDGNDVQIKTSKETVLYPAEEFKKYLFADANDTGIASVGNEGKFVVNFDGNGISVKGAPSHALLQLYDASGALVADASTDAQGTVSLTTSNLNSGMYIVKIKNHNFKFLKR